MSPRCSQGKPCCCACHTSAAFLPFDREQIASHLGFGLLARFMRQCAGVVAFGVDFSIRAA